MPTCSEGATFTGFAQYGSSRLSTENRSVRYIFYDTVFTLILIET